MHLYVLEIKKVLSIPLGLQRWFSFSLKDSGSLKGLEIQIEFTSDTSVFWRPYKYNDKSWKVYDSIKDPKVVGGLI